MFKIRVVLPSLQGVWSTPPPLPPHLLSGNPSRCLFIQSLCMVWCLWLFFLRVIMSCWIRTHANANTLTLLLLSCWRVGLYSQGQSSMCNTYHSSWVAPSITPGSALTLPSHFALCFACLCASTVTASSCSFCTWNAFSPYSAAPLPPCTCTGASPTSSGEHELLMPPHSAKDSCSCVSAPSVAPVKLQWFRSCMRALQVGELLCVH